MAKYCRQCGIQLRDGSKFCNNCGTPVRIKKTDDPEIVEKPKNQEITVDPISPEVAESPKSTEILKTYFDLNPTDAKSAGDITGLSDILSPGRTFVSLFSRTGSGLRGLKIRKASLISVIILCVIWLLLFICRCSGTHNMITVILSWISFGGDASYRSLPGVTGTAVGRGMVALAISSLIAGGGRSLKSGFSELTANAKTAISSDRAGWLITGAGVSLVINRIIAGTPFFSNVMATIALALVSVMAFGNENSWLFILARSVTAAKMPDMTRVADTKALLTLMTGFISGSVLMTVYCAGNSLISPAKDSVFSSLPVIAGIILIIAGIALIFSGRKQKNNL